MFGRKGDTHRDGRVIAARFFHFNGANDFTTAIDNFLASSGNIKISVGIHVAQITSFKPTAFQEAGRLFRLRDTFPIIRQFAITTKARLSANANWSLLANLQWSTGSHIQNSNLWSDCHTRRAWFFQQIGRRRTGDGHTPEMMNSEVLREGNEKLLDQDIQRLCETANKT